MSPLKPEKRFALEALERALVIDKHDLEGCCMQQPDLFYQVAEELALCVSERDAAKVYLSEVEADAQARCREDLEASNTKVTVAMVEAEVVVDAKVKKARADYLDWSARVNTISALKESYQQRSYMLTQLVQLYSLSYYADSDRSPRVRDTDAAQGRAGMANQRRKRLQED